MGCISGLVKLIVFIFNATCAVVGIVFMALGGLFYAGINQFDELTEQKVNVVPSLVIAIGVIIFVIAFLGCCGACTGNKLMLMTYAIILIVLLIIQLVAGIYGYIQVDKNEDEFKANIKKDMDKALLKYYNNNQIKEAFNLLQRELECCGVNDPADYKSLPGFENTFPGSCCGLKDEETCQSAKYTDGCGDKMFDYVHDKIAIVAYVAFAICAVELAGAVFAIWLVKTS